MADETEPSQQIHIVSEVFGLDLHPSEYRMAVGLVDGRVMM